MIEAAEGPYRVAPGNVGGMQVEGQGDTAHKASEGQQPQGNLSMRVPEAPVDGQPKAAPGQPAEKGAQPAQQPARPQPAPAPTPAPAVGGPSIQLGAFSSQAAAQSAWQAMSGRFRYLAPLSHSVSPVQAGGRTLYRLRASGPNAADICRRLQVAGEACTAVR